MRCYGAANKRNERSVHKQQQHAPNLSAEPPVRTHAAAEQQNGWKHAHNCDPTRIRIDRDPPLETDPFDAARVVRSELRFLRSSDWTGSEDTAQRGSQCTPHNTHQRTAQRESSNSAYGSAAAEQQGHADLIRADAAHTDQSPHIRTLLHSSDT